jgi:virginiamycin B lyase
MKMIRYVYRLRSSAKSQFARNVVTTGPDGDLWTTENFANKIARMAPDGTMLGEYDIPTPASGARCISAMSNGRLYFTQWDAGLIGEIIIN